MKKLFILIALIATTITSVYAMSYDEAKQQNKPMIIMFHMNGCSACRKFSSKFDKFASMFASKFNFLKEDVNSSKIASICTSETVPAFYVLKPKSQKAQRISDDCVWDKGCFTKFLQDYK